MFSRTMLARFLGTSTKRLDSILKELGLYSPFLGVRYTSEQAQAVMVVYYHWQARRPGDRTQGPGIG